LELHHIGIDIATVLVNLPNFIEKSQEISLERKHVKYLKRIINYIMAKLNSWGLGYWSYPKFSYAHINKIKENDTQKMYEKQKEFKNILFLNEPQSYQC